MTVGGEERKGDSSEDCCRRHLVW